MGILDRLRKALGGAGAGPGDGYNYWVRVRCAMCGEIIRGRVDLRNELSLTDDAEGFFVRKRLIGSGRCFNPIDVTLSFDLNRRLVDRQITGGEFVEDEDPEAGQERE